ncbi:MAG: NTP transferase domain-containing protein [Actinomycetia bacterium]|nr:NTP transferase domain-containing protein [Actinomycetes bacterium]
MVRALNESVSHHTLVPLGGPGISAIVLAAGQGTRMRSTRPKPLHLLCGRTMVQYVLDSLSGLPLSRAVVVVGHGAEQVRKRLSEDNTADRPLDFVEQVKQKGTGDAVAVGLTAFTEQELDADLEADVVVLPGDTPLLRADTVTELVTRHRSERADCTVLTARLHDATGYGRVVRNKDGDVQRIVEHRDASPEELAINEINTSIYCFKRSLLGPALRQLSPQNSQGEYYLTDVVAFLHSAGYRVRSMVADDSAETHGVNDRNQLAGAEGVLRARTNARWMAAGVTMLDPERTYVDATVTLGEDVTLFPGTILQGDTRIGDRCEIGPDTRLVDCRIGPGAIVEKAMARDAEIGEEAHVGPFAVLQPGAHVGSSQATGPFYTAPEAGS